MREFMTVFRQRALETCGGWLVGITVCSQMLFGFLTFYAGMSLAVVLSVLTIRKGLWESPHFYVRSCPMAWSISWCGTCCQAGPDRCRKSSISCRDFCC